MARYSSKSIMKEFGLTRKEFRSQYEVFRRKVSNFNEVNKMIKEADESMYEYKQAFKKTKNNADR